MTSPLGTHTLGRDGPVGSAPGLGCMGMSPKRGAADRQEAIATIHRALDDLGEDDFRRDHRRFPGGALQVNLRPVDRVRELATEKGVTPGRLALARVLARGVDVLPVPGTTWRSHLEENAGAAAVHLHPDELARLDGIAPPGVAVGGRCVDSAYSYGDSAERTA